VERADLYKPEKPSGAGEQRRQAERELAEDTACPGKEDRPHEYFPAAHEACVGQSEDSSTAAVAKK